MKVFPVPAEALIINACGKASFINLLNLLSLLTTFYENKAFMSKSKRFSFTNSLKIVDNIIGRSWINIFNFLIILSFFILVAFSEMLLGVLRTIFINKYLGVKAAKQLSLLPALLMCIFISYCYLPFLGIFSYRGLLLGIGLSSFMLVLDILVGRYLVKLSFAKIIDDFNIRKGNLLVVGLILMAFCPLLAFILKNH